MKLEKHFDDNKYRVRYGSFGTKAYSRDETITTIAQFQKAATRIWKRKLFCQRTISPAHNQALMDCARLFNKLNDTSPEYSRALIEFAKLSNTLDKMEKDVKDRPARGIAIT